MAAAELDDLDLRLVAWLLLTDAIIDIFAVLELVYGVKAMLPIELDLPTHTFQQDDDDGNHMENVN